MYFLFHQRPPSELYPLSLHDALPISILERRSLHRHDLQVVADDIAQPLSLEEELAPTLLDDLRDRKSTRLNSSHRTISYAVFCLKKKKDGPWGLSGWRDSDEQSAQRA